MNNYIKVTKKLAPSTKYDDTKSFNYFSWQH